MTIRIDGANTAANPGITGTDTDTGLQFGTDEVNIVTGGTTAVTVDSSQRVGIGTESASEKLHISGTGDIKAKIATTSTGVNANAAVQLDAGTEGNWVLQTGNAVSDGLRFYDAQASSERARFLSGGGLTFNGDTAAANALDDYEEGTWTPTVTTGTVGTAFAKYTKIGRQVTVAARLSQFSDRSSSAAVVVGNLPYDGDGSNPQAAGSAFFRYVNNQFTTVYLDGDDLLFYLGGAGGFDSMQHQDITDSNAEIYFFATYFTA